MNDIPIAASSKTYIRQSSHCDPNVLNYISKAKNALFPEIVSIESLDSGEYRYEETFIRGMTLEEKIKKGADKEEFIDAVRSAADAYNLLLHDNSLSCRNISTDNIIFGTDGEIYICGCAEYADVSTEAEAAKAVASLLRKFDGCEDKKLQDAADSIDKAETLKSVEKILYSPKFFFRPRNPVKGILSFGIGKIVLFILVMLVFTISAFKANISIDGKPYHLAINRIFLFIALMGTADIFFDVTHLFRFLPFMTSRAYMLRFLMSVIYSLLLIALMAFIALIICRII